MPPETLEEQIARLARDLRLLRAKQAAEQEVNMARCRALYDEIHALQGRLISLERSREHCMAEDTLRELDDRLTDLEAATFGDAAAGNDDADDMTTEQYAEIGRQVMRMSTNGDYLTRVANDLFFAAPGQSKEGFCDSSPAVALFRLANRREAHTD